MSLTLRVVMCDERHRVQRVMVEDDGREVGELRVSRVAFESSADKPMGWWTFLVEGFDVDIERMDTPQGRPGGKPHG